MTKRLYLSMCDIDYFQHTTMAIFVYTDTVIACTSR